MLAASNGRSPDSLFRWRLLVYLLLLLAALALGLGERAAGYRPTPVPSTGGSHAADD